MKAALLTEANTPLVIEEVEAGPLGATEARVRVDASGVCRTDLSLATTDAVPFPLPVILGHEGVGTVLEIGSAVQRIKVGDRVIGSFVPVCGSCWFCVRGESTQCERMMDLTMTPRARRDGQDVIGLAGLGTFAEMMTVDERALVPVETDLSAEELALIGCGVTTGAGAALWTAQVKPGSTVAVFGCGGVGQFVIQGARIAGAARIFAVDPVEMKRTSAAQQGATDLIDPAAGDSVEQLRSATAGRGVDYAFEVTGDADVILQAYDAVRPRGTAVAVGMPAPTATVTLPAATLFAYEKRIIGSFYGSAEVLRDFPALVSLAEAGRLDIKSAISRRIRLDGINDAFRAMASGEVIRSVITPE